MVRRLSVLVCNAASVTFKVQYIRRTSLRRKKKTLPQVYPRGKDVETKLMG